MSEKCSGGCRPTSCFAHGRRLVMNLRPDGPYEAEQLHYPCGQPGCDAARLCRELDEKENSDLVRLGIKPGNKTQPSTFGDADLDRREAELREAMCKLGLK
jgi:hypothetical protein